MSPRTKKILAIVLLIIIVIIICIGVYFIFFNKSDDSWRIKRIGADPIVNHRDYHTSRLWIHSNNTFEMEIIETIGEDTQIIFTGVGTYTRTRNTYTFTFIDSYTNPLIGPTLPENQRPPYQVNKGQIRFDSHWGISYYFGR